MNKRRKQTGLAGIIFVREMDEGELRKAMDQEPTIDSIEMAECETQEAVQAWLK